MLLITVIVIAVLVLILVYPSIRILREYERGVAFTLGRYTVTKGPGLFLLVPFVQQMVRVDLRVIVDEVPPQDVISRDNVSVKVSAVIYFRVIDAERAIIQVSNYLAATSQLAQTTLRWVLGKHDLDQMLAERDWLRFHGREAGYLFPHTAGVIRHGQLANYLERQILADAQSKTGPALGTHNTRHAQSHSGRLYPIGQGTALPRQQCIVSGMRRLRQRLLVFGCLAFAPSKECGRCLLTKFGLA
jgi:hypothetical protein